MSPDVLDSWPDRKVRDYLTVMNETTKWQEVQAEMARRRAAAESRGR